MCGKYLKSLTSFFTVALLLFSLSIFAQESKDIGGTITHNNAPIPDVNISIEGTSYGTKTDVSGNYTLKAKPGDVIVYSHVGFNSVFIIVEDVTSTLNITLTQKTNQLEETVVIGRKKTNKALEYERLMDVDIETPYGTFNPKKSGFSVKHIKADRLNEAAPTLADALNGKFAGLVSSGGVLFIRGRPASFVMDGVLMDPKYLPFSYFEDIYIINATSTVFLITKNSPEARQRERNRVAEQYKNQNYYNDDAIAAPSESVTSSTQSPKPSEVIKKEIYGTITYADNAIPDVIIKIKGTPNMTKTDAKGYYNILVEIGEELEFSHSRFRSVTIIVEDITQEINIDMVSYTNALDEVLVTAKTKEGKVLKRAVKAKESFDTSRGRINPNSAGYAVSFVDGDDISNTYISLKEALIGKISGYSVNPSNGKAYMRGANTSMTQDYPVAWEIDGVFTTQEPVGFDLSQIESIRALKSLAATNKYGTLGAGGVIVIKTKFGNYEKEKGINSKIDQKYTNNNYYADDAIEVNTQDLLSNAFTQTLQGYKNKGKAYRYYNENLKETITDFEVHIDIAQLFLIQYNDRYKALTIFKDLAASHQKNPEILKAIAFHLQTMNATRDATTIFKHIAKMRPQYGQSYRDLANAYKDNNEFKMSWRIYMNYLMNRKADKASALDQIVYNEMEYLYFNRQHQTDIKEQFVPNNESKIKFRNDVRFVVEWNTSEAEFDLEFVAPDKRAYVLEHTLAANQDLITDEKLKGYSSDEFFVDDIGTGEWLVNLTYYGNKKSAPTYLKLTTYYHWGKPKQHQEIAVYKLEKEDQKIQLKKINSQTLLTFN